MRSRLREAIGLGIVLVVVLIVETYGLRSGKTGLLLVGMLAVFGLIIVGVRAEISRIAVFSGLACVFTLGWNAVNAGPGRIGDILIFVTALAVIAARPNDAFSAPPWWVKQILLVLVIGVLVQVFFPPDAGFLAERVQLSTGGKRQGVALGDLSILNILTAFKIATDVAIIPIALVGVVRIDRRALRWLIVSFTVGTAVSGWIAMSGYLGLDLAHYLTGLGSITNRQAGLTLHPNYLAGSVVCAIPFAFWLAAGADRRLRLVGVVSLAGLLLGDYTSGSRGGTVGGVIALVLCVALHPRTRPYVVNYAIGGLVAIGIVATVLPSFGQTILRVTRLSNPAVTGGSDYVRDLVADQAWRDFDHSPFTGIGLQVLDSASQAYLGALAGGGILLVTGLVLYTLGAAFEAARRTPTSDLAGTILAAVLTVAALRLVEPGLADRFYYFAPALLLAVLDLEQRDRSASAKQSARRAPAPGTPVTA